MLVVTSSIGAQSRTRIAGRLGELRYHGEVIAILDTWSRSGAYEDRLVGTSVARLTFSTGRINQFWVNFGAPTHVALPTRAGGPRRVYELLTCDLRAGRAQFRTPPCAIEGPRR